MLFNSYIFIFCFLPLTFLVFLALAHYARPRAALGWLVLASLFFYGWWNPRYLALIALSMAFNFGCGQLLTSRRRSRAVLTLGVAVNLGVLGWFKYANWFVEGWNEVTSSSVFLAPIALPLAISFFTFQQIAYLVDTWRHETEEHQPFDYALFVTFFPQLIAGPIVHHREVLPQFLRPETFHPHAIRIAAGITFFAMGLCKKVVFADRVAEFVQPAFDAVARGQVLNTLEAWMASWCFGVQVYFDFSGYSDMAIGLALMFGITLPINFHSPLRATSIVEFWRRWHMTLGRFLREYVYIPLGGNRKGQARRYLNLWITMVLLGLWHGAGWTYVAFGAVHGVYLAGNHAWQLLRRRWGLPGAGTTGSRVLARAVTMLAVTFAWPVFQAADLGDSWSVVRSMATFGGSGWSTRFAEDPADAVLFVAFVTAWVWILPNTHQLFGKYLPRLPQHPNDPLPQRWSWLAWRPTPAWAVITAGLTLLGVLHLTRIQEFFYFQF